METKKSSIPLSPSSDNLRQVGLDLSLLALAACLIFVYLFGLQIARGVFLGSLMSSKENIATLSSPDHQITALVVSDSCGTTRHCTVRVELKTEDRGCLIIPPVRRNEGQVGQRQAEGDKAAEAEVGLQDLLFKIMADQVPVGDTERE
jgi:hypothetical protein